MDRNRIVTGNCLDILPGLLSESVDLVYLDPPFFSQKKHVLSNRDHSQQYQFDDIHQSEKQYIELIGAALEECRRILKDTGSVFVHCDRTACHYIRFALDAIFGKNNFQNEIIWSYRRWSNSRKGLLNSHQNILFYSKTSKFTFNKVYTDYAPSTNLDQILQERRRDSNGRAVYKKDENGSIVIAAEKKGVPLSDVWEIPYLNPKARERTGYPTQKPILLLNRIIDIGSRPGDLVLDPFCGSGTTCVAALTNGRDYLGIDISPDATRLAESRLAAPIVTESQLLKRGADQYVEKTEGELAVLAQLDAFPVHRNAGIDGFLRQSFGGMPVPVKIQREYESLQDSIEKLEKATRANEHPVKIVVQTQRESRSRLFDVETSVQVVKSLALQVDELRAECVVQDSQTLEASAR